MTAIFKKAAVISIRSFGKGIPFFDGCIVHLSMAVTTIAFALVPHVGLAGARSRLGSNDMTNVQASPDLQNLYSYCGFRGRYLIER